MTPTDLDRSGRLSICLHVEVAEFDVENGYQIAEQTDLPLIVCADDYGSFADELYRLLALWAGRYAARLKDGTAQDVVIAANLKAATDKERHRPTVKTKAG